jgi:hypothetical protein
VFTTDKYKGAGAFGTELNEDQDVAARLLGEALKDLQPANLQQRKAAAGR